MQELWSDLSFTASDRGAIGTTLQQLRTVYSKEEYFQEN